MDAPPSGTPPPPLPMAEPLGPPSCPPPIDEIPARESVVLACADQPDEICGAQHGADPSAAQPVATAGLQSDFRKLPVESACAAITVNSVCELSNSLACALAVCSPEEEEIAASVDVVATHGNDAALSEASSDAMNVSASQEGYSPDTCRNSRIGEINARMSISLEEGSISPSKVRRPSITATPRLALQALAGSIPASPRLALGAIAKVVSHHTTKSDVKIRPSSPVISDASESMARTDSKASDGQKLNFMQRQTSPATGDGSWETQAYGKEQNDGNMDNADVHKSRAQEGEVALEMLKRPEFIENLLALTGLADLEKAIKNDHERRAHPDFPHDFPWINELVQDMRFELFVGAAVAVNGLTIGMQASDINGDNESILNVLEHFFVVFFVIEWVLRLLANGWTYPLDFYNFLDSLLVFFTGVMVKWIMEPAGLETSQFRMFTVLRIFRITRVARALRLMPSFKEMWILIHGLRTSMRPLLWTLVIIGIVLYMWAIIFTEIIGKDTSFRKWNLVANHTCLNATAGAVNSIQPDLGPYAGDFQVAGIKIRHRSGGVRCPGVAGTGPFRCNTSDRMLHLRLRDGETTLHPTMLTEGYQEQLVGGYTIQQMDSSELVFKSRSGWLSLAIRPNRSYQLVFDPAANQTRSSYGTTCVDVFIEATDPVITELFGNILKSMFTLFQLMTLDTWADTIARPVMAYREEYAVFIIIFITLTVFVLMNLITAIIVQNAQSIRENDDESKAKAVVENKQAELKQLTSLFLEIDQDSNGVLTYNEFEEALENPAVIRILNVLELPETDLIEVWTTLDDGDGLLTVREFTDGIRRMKGEATAKDTLDAIKRLRETSMKHAGLRKQADALQATMEDLEADTTKVADDMREVLGLFHEMHQRLDHYTASFKKEHKKRGQEQVLVRKNREEEHIKMLLKRQLKDDAG